MNAHTQVLPALSIIEARKQLIRDLAENDLLDDFRNGTVTEHELLIDGMKRFEKSISRFVHTVAETAQFAGNARFDKWGLPKDFGDDLFDWVICACEKRVEELQENAR
jgi:hypothetical protein